MAKTRAMRKTRKVTLVLILSLLLVLNEFAFVSVQALPAGDNAVPPLRGIPGKDYLPGEIIVKFKPGVNRDTMHKAAKTRVVKTLRDNNAQLVKVLSNTEMANALHIYRSDPRVEYAEPNYIRRPYITPNDPGIKDQWAISKMKMPQAWDKVKSWDPVKGSGNIKIAIIDTGVDLDHEDLTNLVSGTDIYEGDSVPDDEIGHGTHVAGIAAAVANNGAGVAGVAGGAKIMPVKVIDFFGTDEDVANGIRWAADHGAKVINMSLGGPEPSKVLEDAVNYAYSKGVVIVAAAGNEETDEPSYPAAYNHVISVAATDSGDQQADFSNYGPTIDVAAPGVDIYSTLPNHSHLFEFFAGKNYGALDGTSMASPQVAGLAALILTKNPSLTPDQVESIIKATADDLGVKGVDEIFGCGRINALRAVSLDLDNNSWDSAPLVNTGVSLKGKISPANDFDLFKYQLPGKMVKVQLTVPAGIDGRIDIYNSSRQRVKTINKSGTGVVEKELLNLPAGSYFFKVSDTAGKTSSTLYTLTVNDEDIYEPNNSIQTVKASPGLPLGTTAYDRIYPQGDIDYFKINLPSDGTLKISFITPKDAGGSPLETMDGKITLYDSNNFDLAVADTKQFGNETLFKGLKAGAYFIKVENCVTDYVCTREYGLNVNFLTGSIVVNQNQSVTNSTSVTLSLSAASKGGQISTMQFSNDGRNWYPSTPETFKNSKKWSLSAGDGVKKVYVKFRNNLGNYYVTYDTIRLTTS